MFLSKTIAERIEEIYNNSVAAGGIFVLQKTVNPIAAGNTNLFSIGTGGSIRIISLSGVVNGAIQSLQCMVKLVASTPAGDRDICVALDLNAASIFSLLTITGIIAEGVSPADAMLLEAEGSAISQANDFIVGNASSTGYIVMNNNNDERSGSIVWYCVYQKLSSSAAFAAV